MLSIISITFRAFQILFAIVVVGLSVTFMKAQEYGNSPTTTRYSVFVGAFGMLVGVLGLIAVFLDRIPSLVPMVADGLGALLSLAGGIAWAVAMKSQSCTEASLKKLYDNALLNQGCPPDQHLSSNEGPYCFVAGKQTEDPWPLTSLWPDPMKGLCQKAFANEAFQFAMCASFFILIGLGFLQSKRKGLKSRYVA
ncbi:unnamed protein product [Discula destructiva]